MRYYQCALLALIMVIGFETDAGDIVKKTTSGICHPPASSYYERTKNFRPFESVEACLASDGRLPKSLADLNSARLAKRKSESYERSDFGHGWVDTDADCQDSRAEALIATSSTAVRFATENKCRVVTGRWISPFTGQIIQNSSNIDIDHVVPLKWAWDHGAKDWTQAKREHFANDMANLWPVELGLNRSKGAKPPSKWLPPSGRCGYVARFARLVNQYGLKPPPSEELWLGAFLEACGS